MCKTLAAAFCWPLLNFHWQKTSNASQDLNTTLWTNRDLAIKSKTKVTREEWQSHLWTMNDEDGSFYEDYLCLLSGRRRVLPLSERMVAKLSTFHKKAGAYFPRLQRAKYRKRPSNCFERRYGFQLRTIYIYQSRWKKEDLDWKLWVCPLAITLLLFWEMTIQPTPFFSGLEMVLAPLTSSLSKHTQQLKHKANMAPNLCTMARPHISPAPNK